MNHYSVKEYEAKIAELAKSSGLIPGGFTLSLSLKRVDDNSIAASRQIIEIVCKYYGIEVERLRHRTRKNEVSFARAACAYFIKAFTSLDLVTIDVLVRGKKDHTATKYYVETLYPSLNTDDYYKSMNEGLYYLISKTI